MKKPAFTITETIIAITVIATVIVAAFSLAQSSISMANSSIQRFAALELASEGIEIVRNMRDSNWLQNKDWRAELSDGVYYIAEGGAEDGYPWRLAPITSTVTAPLITLRENQKFKRTIEIKADMTIISRVIYMSGNKEKEVMLDAKLTNWKKGPL